MSEIRPLRKNKQFQLLWIGGALSQTGKEVTKLAMPLLVIALTGSPAWAGIIAGSVAVAHIFGQIPAGAWADRWDRRRLLLIGQSLRFVNSALLASLILTDHVQVWHFVLLGIIDGLCSALTDPARTTAIRGVVPTSQLQLAYTQEESRSHAARLVGPPLGGLLYGVARVVPFLAEAVLFLLSALCTLFARVPRRPSSENEGTPEAVNKPKSNMRQELAESVAWLWRQPGLREVYAAVLMLNLLGGAFLIPVIVLVGERGGDSVNTGIVLTGTGIGGLIGALLSNRIGKLLPPGKLLIAVVAIFGVALVSMALPLGPWWPMLPLVVITLSTPAINVVMNVVIARMVLEEMLGRMIAVLNVAAHGLAPLGPAIGGMLAAAMGGAGALILVGGLLVLTSLGASASRELRGFTGEAPAEEGRDQKEPPAPGADSSTSPQ
ncbi:MFS transporter [Nocardiopsis kunsanensis]|uniref:MFS transporter n=1 Tax=Nocardiopsis kunsanensis TaxID=141693 RepID=UPI00034B6146|nr:MFS transporter [Nocardiopsis kunsanensis]